MSDEAPTTRSREETRCVAALEDALGADFEILQRLGRGSMATVYLAREKALGRLVAVKVLLPGRARDETPRKRFEREAKAYGSLAHPNVVQVYRFGRLRDETPYLVMRFVKGRTIEERLAAEGRLPSDVARKVLHDVASALAAAHAHGIAHRDVRGANVLWDEESQDAVLTDFGIAAILATSGEESTRLTNTGQIVGDPRYLSPEQLRDDDLTELVDMYAFGILGYEVYTGEGPYEAVSTRWVDAHLSGKPRDIRRLRPDIEPEVADLLRKCLNPEPNRRPTAANAARTLQPPEHAPPSAVTTHGSLSAELKRRRFPQFVAGALAGGVGVVSFVALLREMYDVDLVWVSLAFPFAACGVVAASVVAWFHGERGAQESSATEWVLLSLTGLVWLALTAWIVAR